MQKINNLLHRNRDANHNGIPDSQERNVYGTNSLNDRNHNGIPDSQERQGPIEKVKNLLHLNKDANHNGIPDSQERGVYGNNALLPQGVPQQNLGYKRSLHQELLGRNGMWNLRKAQTRSYFPRDYYNMETGFEREWAQSGQSQSLPTRQAPINLERVEKEVVVHEHIHPVEKEEIQPVIYREREQLDIKQITQQLHETQIQPTFVQKRELAPEYREAIVERGAPIQENLVLPTVDRDVTLKSQVVHAPIVNETIKKTVIEEIQPVLERDIIQSTLIQETKNIYEKVIEAPTVYRETTIIQDRGINGGSLSALSAQGFNLGSYYSGSNDVNMNGIPDNLERNTQFGNDRNMNGIPDNLEGGMRHNPLDRNHDGRVNLQDLKSTDRNHNGIPDSQERLGQGFAGGLNDRNMNGIPDSQERFGAKTLNPLDRNNDGKVDLKDLTANKQQAPLRAL